MLRLTGLVVLVAALAACQASSPEQSRRDLLLQERSDLLAEALLCNQGYELRDPQAAIEGCTGILQRESLRTTWLAAYITRGILFRRLGQDAEALADFTAAIEHSPNAPEGYISRGKLFSDQGKHALAEQDFKSALGVDPDNPAALNNYAWALLAKADYGTAYELTEKALPLVTEPGAIGSTSPQVVYSSTYDTQAHALMGLGREDDAKVAFSRAMEFGGTKMIKRYQQALAKKGYNPGPVDGMLDAQTRAALSDCIRDNCRLLLD